MNGNRALNHLFFTFFSFLILTGVLTVSPAQATAEPFFQGAKVCQECHDAENEVWEKTKHYTSYRTAHREPKDKSKPSPKKILAAVGGQKRMKRNKACSLCHYTLEQKNAESKAVARSGNSCESCHGASSEWLAIHDNYGGKNIKRDQETPEHKKQRFEKSRSAGLIWPNMKYQVAENCMTCHGLAHPDLTGDTLAKMLGAGHPINPDFELVKYSQGSVRHRYYPPNRSTNAEMTPKEQAELFVTGHAAALVSAAEAQSKSKEPKYTKAQNKRAENAKAALSAVKSIPEAAALIASPTRENALKLVDAIQGKDLTAEVGKLLPAKGDYK
ncbi:MAG: cytochrome c554 [Nitrospinaceae bacterium]|nr:MAG: cytochrome c554 [Nitrospinaceae bacterium]